MYYRRKVILALLQVFENKLDKISLQKLLFLVCRFQETPSFNFIPYKFGCYSFQANADLKTMTKYEMVNNEDKAWVKIDKTDYMLQLKDKDKTAVKNVKNIYGNRSAEELIKLTYQKYPYFAIKSTIAERVLTDEEYNKIKKNTPCKNETVLFTIGYEGITLEQYLNKLIINDVKLLCDVRKNPLSMKFGFSKTQLQKACDGLGIKYLHIPELGINSEHRQELNSQSDYDMLFDMYKSEVLSETQDKQKSVLDLLDKFERIALTCFEADINQCHRKHLAESLVNLSGNKYNLKHI